MIIEELLGNNLVKRYSDRHVLLEQVDTGDRYSEPIDLITAPIHYIETDILIEDEEIDDGIDEELEKEPEEEPDENSED